MAIGYTLIVGVVGLITFAYGEMVMIGAMSAYLFYTYVTPNFFLGLLVAFISSGIAGIFIHKIAYERFLDMKRLQRGDQSVKSNRRIHNRYVFGAFASIAERLMNEFTEDAVARIKAADQGKQ